MAPLLLSLFNVIVRPMLLPMLTVVGVALRPKVAHGETVAPLHALSQLAFVGPALHPHQLFVARAFPGETVPSPVVPLEVFPKMRLRVTCNDWLPVGLSGPTAMPPPVVVAELLRILVLVTVLSISGSASSAKIPPPQRPAELFCTRDVLSIMPVFVKIPPPSTVVTFPLMVTPVKVVWGVAGLPVRSVRKSPPADPSAPGSLEFTEGSAVLFEIVVFVAVMATAGKAMYTPPPCSGVPLFETLPPVKVSIPEPPPAEFSAQIPPPAPQNIVQF